MTLIVTLKELYFIVSVDCGQPKPPANGYLMKYSSTKEGANISFRCDNEDTSSAAMQSTICNSRGMWVPLPEKYTCLKHQGIMASMIMDEEVFVKR